MQRTVDITSLPSALRRVCTAIADAGGRAWLVGGSVRDLYLGHTPGDFDIEVFALDEQQLLTIARRFGRTEQFGKAFGIIKLWCDGHEIDIALPRTERKQGQGHRGFQIHIDPSLDERTATLRRDFTINAMMLDPLSGKLLDFHGGLHDLAQHCLRHVSAAFAEDPLRPLRAMQFAARFRMTLHPDTATLCRTLLCEADALPLPRIWQEWRKWALAPFPACGLRALQDSGWLTLYPELEALSGCPQDPRWHPEGDVWTHTCLAVDVAAKLARKNRLDAHETIILIFAELCHDLGKPLTTFSDAQQHIRSPNHSQAAQPLIKALLKRIAVPKRYHDHIHALVMEHMCHMHGQPTERAVRRLAHRLQPATIALWEMLVEADASGRHPAEPSRPALPWLEQAEAIQHHQQPPKPIVNGKMLMSLGIAPGPLMGRIIRRAYQAQLDGSFSDEASAIRWLKEHTPAQQPDF